MGGSSSIMKEQQLSEFRKLNPDSQAEIELPAPAKIRSLTDKKGFVIFGILMLVLFPFLIYTLAKSDIRRLAHRYDSCGNLCGVANKKIDGIECSGKNYTGKPYLKVLPATVVLENRTCTDECSPGQLNSGRCYDGNEFDNGDIIDNWNLILTESFKNWWKFIIIVIITTILCILTLLLFRYFPGVIVWGVTVISLLLALALAGIFWFLYVQLKDNENSGFILGLALILTVFTLVILVIFLVLFKKIKLIIQLYKETAKALFAMPLLMFLPIITLFIQLLVLALLAVTTIYMQSSANLVKNEVGLYDFKRNGVMIFTVVFNAIVTLWALQFFSGCQYMVIAGSVAHWFFKKGEFNSPIIISFTNTVRYHLGTVALGSFIITLVAVIKAWIKSMINNHKFRWLVDCICGNIEAFLKFLSKNAYIQTAIHGQSFFRSGKRAARLLLTNAGSVISLNSVGDFVLAMTQFLLLAISTGIAYGIFSNETYWGLPVGLSFVANLVIVIMVFNVFETIVDTLFICFCEDTTLNDGTTRPYYMSTGLMQFVEDSKKVYKEKK